MQCSWCIYSALNNLSLPGLESLPTPNRTSSPQSCSIMFATKLPAFFRARQAHLRQLAAVQRLGQVLLEQHHRSRLPCRSRLLQPLLRGVPPAERRKEQEGTSTPAKWTRSARQRQAAARCSLMSYNLGSGASRCAHKMRNRLHLSPPPLTAAAAVRLPRWRAAPLARGPQCQSPHLIRESRTPRALGFMLR